VLSCRLRSTLRVRSERSAAAASVVAAKAKRVSVEIMVYWLEIRLLSRISNALAQTSESLIYTSHGEVTVPLEARARRPFPQSAVFGEPVVGRTEHVICIFCNQVANCLGEKQEESSWERLLAN
jgi:hypothetical protein